MNKNLFVFFVLVAMFFNSASAAQLHPFFQNNGSNHSAEELVQGLQSRSNQAQIEPNLMLAWLKTTHRLYTGTGTGADGPSDLDTWSGMLRLLQDRNHVELVNCNESMTLYGLTKIRGGGSVDFNTGLLSGDVSTLTRGCYPGEQIFRLKNWNGEWVNWFSARCLNGIVSDSSKFAPAPQPTQAAPAPVSTVPQVQYSQPETIQVAQYSQPEIVVVNQQQSWVVQYNNLPAPVARDGWYCTRGLGEFFTCAVVLYAAIEVIDYYHDGAAVAGPTIPECPGILPPGTIPAPVVLPPVTTATPIPNPVTGGGIPNPETGGGIPNPETGGGIPNPETGSVPNPVSSPGVPNPFPSPEVPDPTGGGSTVPSVPNPGGTGTPGPDPGGIVPNPIPDPVGGGTAPGIPGPGDTGGGTTIPPDGGAIPPPG